MLCGTPDWNEVHEVHFSWGHDPSCCNPESLLGTATAVLLLLLLLSSLLVLLLLLLPVTIAAVHFLLGGLLVSVPREGVGRKAQWE